MLWAQNASCNIQKRTNPIFKKRYLKQAEGHLETRKRQCSQHHNEDNKNGSNGIFVAWSVAKNSHQINTRSNETSKHVRLSYNKMKNILRIASIALQTLRSRTRASAELWNVRPNRLLPVHQWWNVGFAFVYCRSFFSGQFSTTWHQHTTPSINRQLETWTQWQCRVLDTSVTIMWPWHLIFWPRNLISS